MLVNIILRIARWMKIGVRPASADGFQLLRRTIYFISSPRSQTQTLHVDRGGAAAEFVCARRPRNLIDVGAGGLLHSVHFASEGIETTAVDFGSSVYAAERSGDFALLPLTVIDGDFLSIELPERYEILFCSHTLEHQPNIGKFLRACIDSVQQDGFLVFVLPYPHWDLQGGHVAQLSPKSVIYNLALMGLDCSESMSFDSHGEFTVVVRKIGTFDVSERNLTFDKGDIAKLSDKLPAEVTEGSHSYKSWDTLRLGS